MMEVNAVRMVEAGRTVNRETGEAIPIIGVTLIIEEAILITEAVTQTIEAVVILTTVAEIEVVAVTVVADINPGADVLLMEIIVAVVAVMIIAGLQEEDINDKVRVAEAVRLTV